MPPRARARTRLRTAFTYFCFFLIFPGSGLHKAMIRLAQAFTGIWWLSLFGPLGRRLTDGGLLFFRLQHRGIASTFFPTRERPGEMIMILSSGAGVVGVYVREIETRD
jgi:hypothetical protein